jgi:hypothetical protein
MADDTKNSYPLMPKANWWAIRNKFKQTIPTTVTPTYVASIFKMSPESARKNVLPTLKQAGIIDQDGKPSERARRWRDDEQYPTVCEEIKKEIYPQELLDAVPDPVADRSGAERWFANHTGSGQVGVRKMVAFYSLLSEADPGKVQEKPPKARAQPAKPKNKGDQTPAGKDKEPELPDPDRSKKDGARKQDEVPSLNINIQIHISSDASPGQIDQIFESMAKHLYKSRFTQNE